MRIILKPGGVIIILAVLATLVYGIWSGFQPLNPGVPDKAVVLVPASPTPAASLTPTPGNDNLLANPDFETGFEKAVTDSDRPKAVVTGSLAKGWGDSTAWANLSLAYDQETNNPHGGKYCQKITVSKKVEGQAQLLQKMPDFFGKKIRASVWLRADRPVNTIVLLRHVSTFDNDYGHLYIKPTSTWQEYEITGDATKHGEVVFMVAVQDNGTIYVDDAHAQVIGNATSTPAR